MAMDFDFTAPAYPPDIPKTPLLPIFSDFEMDENTSLEQLIDQIGSEICPLANQCDHIFADEHNDVYSAGDEDHFPDLCASASNQSPEIPTPTISSLFTDTVDEALHGDDESITSLFRNALPTDCYADAFDSDYHWMTRPLLPLADVDDEWISSQNNFAALPNSSVTSPICADHCLSPESSLDQPPIQEEPNDIVLVHPLSSIDIASIGIKNSDGSWSCRRPECQFRKQFKRPCDLRKHYKRHTKPFTCRHANCRKGKQSFSNRQERDRHEAKHNPSTVCEFTGCGRVFSRVDNMRDHMRRKHKN